VHYGVLEPKRLEPVYFKLLYVHQMLAELSFRRG
jgi:hypothetical protein